MLKTALCVIVLAGSTSLACGGSTLQPSGQGGSGGQGGAGGAAGTTGEGGTTGGAGTTGVAGATGQGGTTGACAIDASTSAAKTLVASIHVTASTNTGSIDVAVYSDGSAERTIGPARYDAGGTGLTPDPKSFPPGSPEVASFLCDLAAAGPVSQLPTASGCPKSVSFGTEMMVTVGTDSSGDLECLADPAPAAATALAHDCDVLTDRRS
jgi:hypothetical protein